jgi:ABC-2 type transport system permease protein
MRRLKKYAKAFELGFQTALEYRLNFLISLISAVYPIVIQTFLWTAIYNGSSQTELYGFTYPQMIAYTFLAGLAARLVHTGFEYEIMEDIKNGKFSTFLVQPLGYFPYRLSAFLGQKLPNLAIVLLFMAAVLVGLNAIWGINVGPGGILLFLVTLALAVILNFLIFYCFSAVAFWIVEIGFLFEGIRIVTVLLSGGIFPLEVFGPTALRVLSLLPFRYTVSFPLLVLNGQLPADSIAQGLAMQVVWIAATAALARLIWGQGGRRYVAVGG